MRETSIFFDLDGTLWDYSAISAKGWGEAMATLPEKPVPPTREDIRRCSGMTPQQVCNIFLPGIDPKRQMEIFDLCTRHCETCGDALMDCLYPHALEVLEELSRTYSLFLVSNCSEDYLNHCLQTVEMRQYFVEVAAYGMFGNGKAESVKNLMKAHGFDKGVYVGDTRMDYAESCKAGTTFIWAAYGFGKVPEAAYRISQIAHLPALLRKLEEEH